MPRRVKEEERTEMIIRGLLKQPENRRCINCQSLGPQYVCTTFWTFVCTICSGVHREFTHRVKSVSMAKFSEEEISALQAGGNERAREIYFKAWDSQRNFYPDGSNLHRLREFVKHVYIDRKYAGENKSLSMVKLDSKNSFSHRRSFDKNDTFERPYSERSSNSSRDDFNERSSFEQASPFKKNGTISFRDILEERSPRNSQEYTKSSSQRNRAARFEIVDDRFRDDGSVKHYDRYSNKESRGGSRSPVSRTSALRPSLPSIRPVKEIAGEKLPVLKIAGPPKSNGEKDVEGSAKSQNTANATIPKPTVANQKQNETVINPNSSIDINAKHELTSTNNPEQSLAITVSENKNESISNTTSAPQKAVSAQNTNSLESLLFDLSTPVSPPPAGASQTNDSQTSTKANEVSSNAGALTVVTVHNDQPLDDISRDLTVQVSQVHQMPSQQQNEAFVAFGNINSSAQQNATYVEPLYNQSNNSPASNELMLVQSVPLEQPSQATDQGDHGSKPTTARKEIPQDLFASNFAPFTPPVSGWHMYQPYGATGYGVQYRHPAMSVAAFPDPSRPKNPFDIGGDDRIQVQAAMFLSMPSLQGGLPNMPPSTALVSQPSPYARQPPPHISPYGMNMPLVSGAYMGQLPNNMPLTRPQGNVNFVKSEDAFSSLNPIYQTSGTNASPTATNSSISRTGNPFG